MPSLVLRYRRPGDDVDTVRTAVVRPGYVFKLPSEKVRRPELVALSDVLSVALVPEGTETKSVDADATGVPEESWDSSFLSARSPRTHDVAPSPPTRWGALPLGEVPS